MARFPSHHAVNRINLRFPISLGEAAKEKAPAGRRGGKYRILPMPNVRRTPIDPDRLHF
jgi:hypothetical protein